MPPAAPAPFSSDVRRSVATANVSSQPSTSAMRSSSIPFCGPKVLVAPNSPVSGLSTSVAATRRHAGQPLPGRREVHAWSRCPGRSRRCRGCRRRSRRGLASTPAPPSLVPEPPSPTTTVVAPPSTAARISSPTPVAGGELRAAVDQVQPDRLGGLDVGDSPTRSTVAGTRSPCGPSDGHRQQLAAQRGVQHVDEARARRRPSARGPARRPAHAGATRSRSPRQPRPPSGCRRTCQGRSARAWRPSSTRAGVPVRAACWARCLDPIVAVVTVPVPPTEAFVGFTAQMGEWWDPMLSPDAATFTNIAVDPDGDVATVHGDEQYVWGRVTTWDPPTSYVQDFWLGHAEEAPRLDVRFEEDEAGTGTACGSSTAAGPTAPRSSATSTRTGTHCSPASPPTCRDRATHPTRAEADLPRDGPVTAQAYYEVDARTFQRSWPDPVPRPPAVTPAGSPAPATLVHRPRRLLGGRGRRRGRRRRRVPRARADVDPRLLRGPARATRARASAPSCWRPRCTTARLPARHVRRHADPGAYAATGGPASTCTRRCSCAASSTAAPLPVVERVREGTAGDIDLLQLARPADPRRRPPVRPRAPARPVPPARHRPQRPARAMPTSTTTACPAGGRHQAAYGVGA